MSEATQQYLIRRATAADAGALARCRLELFREIDHDPSAEREAEFVALCECTMARFADAGLATAWLAEAPEDLSAIGSIVLLAYPRLPTLTSSGTDEGYIVSVYVAPAWRRRGLASALTDTAIAYAREVGMARVRLHATPVGREVYERAGFRRRDDAMEIELTASADV